MANFFADIAQLLSAANTSEVSDSTLDAVGKDECVVGECSRRVRAIIAELHALKEKISDFDDYIEDDGGAAVNPVLLKKWIGERSLLRSKAVLLKELRLIMLCEEFPQLIPIRFVGIRKGWKVVYSEAPDMSEVEPSAGVVMEIVSIGRRPAEAHMADSN